MLRGNIETDTNSSSDAPNTTVLQDNTFFGHIKKSIANFAGKVFGGKSNHNKSNKSSMESLHAVEPPTRIYTWLEDENQVPKTRKKKTLLHHKALNPKKIEREEHIQSNKKHEHLFTAVDTTKNYVSKKDDQFKGNECGDNFSHNLPSVKGPPCAVNIINETTVKHRQSVYPNKAMSTEKSTVAGPIPIPVPENNDLDNSKQVVLDSCKNGFVKLDTPVVHPLKAINGNIKKNPIPLSEVNDKTVSCTNKTSYGGFSEGSSIQSATKEIKKAIPNIKIAKAKFIPQIPQIPKNELKSVKDLQHTNFNNRPDGQTESKGMGDKLNSEIHVLSNGKVRYLGNEYDLHFLKSVVPFDKYQEIVAAVVRERRVSHNKATRVHSNLSKPNDTNNNQSNVRQMKMASTFCTKEIAPLPPIEKIPATEWEPRVSNTMVDLSHQRNAAMVETGYIKQAKPINVCQKYNGMVQTDAINKPPDSINPLPKTAVNIVREDKKHIVTTVRNQLKNKDIKVKLVNDVTETPTPGDCTENNNSNDKFHQPLLEGKSKNVENTNDHKIEVTKFNQNIEINGNGDMSQNSCYPIPVTNKEKTEQTLNAQKVNAEMQIEIKSSSCDGKTHANVSKRKLLKRNIFRKASRKKCTPKPLVMKNYRTIACASADRDDPDSHAFAGDVVEISKAVVEVIVNKYVESKEVEEKAPEDKDDVKHTFTKICIVSDKACQTDPERNHAIFGALRSDIYGIKESKLPGVKKSSPNPVRRRIPSPVDLMEYINKLTKDKQEEDEALGKRTGKKMGKNGKKIEKKLKKKP